MRSSSKFRDRLHEVIFEADTQEGKVFDIIILILIILSVIAVVLESVETLNVSYHKIFVTTEWVLTVVFTIEYILRIYTVNKPEKYVFSFFGMIDLLSILPAYITIFAADTHSLATIRILRLVRIFRVLKISRYTLAGSSLMDALMKSRRKIFLFIGSVFLLTVVLGSIMYVIEGSFNSGYDSIPRAIYWAIVTLTTVGYGDIAPVSSFGQAVSALIMLMGYGIIAIPTGIVSAEMVKNDVKHDNTQVCGNCLNSNHDNDAKFCKACGYNLHPTDDTNK